MFKNGRFGFNAEHSWADAPILSYLIEDALGFEVMKASYDKEGRVASPDRVRPIPAERLRWAMPDEVGCCQRWWIALKSTNFVSSNQIFHYTRCNTPKRVTSWQGPSPHHCARATELLSKKCLSGGEPLATLCPIWSGRSEVQISGQSNRTQCCQRLATAATFLRKELRCLDAMTRRWALQLVTRFGVLQRV